MNFLDITVNVTLPTHTKRIFKDSKINEKQKIYNLQPERVQEIQSYLVSVCVLAYLYLWESSFIINRLWIVTILLSNISYSLLFLLYILPYFSNKLFQFIKLERYLFFFPNYTICVKYRKLAPTNTSTINMI